MKLACVVNAEQVTADVPPRLLLSDFIRHELHLTGTNVGCDMGVCGACTVTVDGAPVRSCLMFAVQADGCEIHTVEGLARARQAGLLDSRLIGRHAPLLAISSISAARSFSSTGLSSTAPR